MLLREQIERQIREKSAQVLSEAKALVEEQGMKLLDSTRAATEIVQKIECTREVLKESFHKAVSDAQQQTFACSNITSITHMRTFGNGAPKLQAFDNRARVVSDEFEDRMRQELCESSSRERENIGPWLKRQTDGIPKMIHDALLEAQAEIKVRSHMSLEIFKNSGEDLQRVLIGELRERAQCASREFERHIDDRLRNFRSSIEASIGEAAKAQIAETVKSFQIEVDGLIQDSTIRCRSTLAQNLKSIADTLDVELRAKSPSQ